VLLAVARVGGSVPCSLLWQGEQKSGDWNDHAVRTGAGAQAIVAGTLACTI